MTTNQPALVDDPILERLDEQVRAQEELEAKMGLTGSRGGPSEEEKEPPPYDLAPEAPRALSLPKLLTLAGQQVPAEVATTIGDYRAIVLLHGLTPFHTKGARPSEIWGLGYESELVDCDAARTVSYEPGNQVIKFAEVDQMVGLELALDGRIAAGLPAVDSLPLAAGISAGATTKQGFALSLNIEWSVVEVQAGPVGAGGVRWNLYRQSSRIDRHHRFVQTALIPRQTRKLQVLVKTWVRRRGGFFGLFGTREWSPPPRSFVIAIET